MTLPHSPDLGGRGFGEASSPAADRRSGLEGARARQGPQQRAPKHWNPSLQSMTGVPYHPMPWHASPCGRQPRSSFLSLLPSGTRDLQHICAPEKDGRSPTSPKARFCFHDDAKTKSQVSVVCAIPFIQFFNVHATRLTLQFNSGRLTLKIINIKTLGTKIRKERPGWYRRVASSVKAHQHPPR